jgi:poly-gamma-glutamate synthesis protein (capsule biosynthesis protein)
MKINFLGDIGLFKRYEDQNIDPFDHVWLPESDLNIGNFEFIIPLSGKKFFYDVQDKYTCSFGYLEKLRIRRFNGFGLANNHCLDYGLEGTLDTIDQLNKLGISVFGFSKDPGYSIGTFESDGIRIGIIACVKQGRWSKENFGYGPDTYDADFICNLIKENLKNFNHIVVFPHWGTELLEVPDLKDTENAKIFIDTGASAVIGHHPHVSQGIERYKNGLIAYSLGSFIYIHEDELGYIRNNKSRNISICLNVEFSENRITGYQGYYYRYNPCIMIPELVDDVLIKKYAEFLDTNIYNQKLYKKQVRNVLLKREIFSFWGRFKQNPISTMMNYFRVISPKNIRKIL